MVHLRIAVVAAVLCSSLVPAAHADDVLEGSPVVRRNLQFRAGRHEVAGQIGLTLGDPYVRNVLPGVRYDLHWKDWLSFGAGLLVGVPIPTATADEIEVKVGATNESFVMEASRIAWMVDAHATVAPLVGKFIAFGFLPVTFDAHVTLAAGLPGIGGTENLPTEFAPSFGAGVGTRFFVSRVLAINVDLQDHFIKRTLAVDRNSKAATGSYAPNMMFLAGVGFFMPPEMTRAD
jgi:hypothetical protein